MAGISTFMGLETTLRGILAHQSALDTTGHNVSNANTEGYSRQQAVLAPSAAMNLIGGDLGTGVTVTTYARIRNQLIDVQYRAQSMRQGAAEAAEGGLNQIQAAFTEPSDTGLNSLLGKYWSAWADVSNAPENLATRQSLAQSAASLCDGFNTLASQLATISGQASSELATNIAQVNSYGGQIAALNDAISHSVADGAQPNDLLDQRDLLLDKLSALGNVSTTAGSLGTVDVTIGGAALVTGTSSSTLAESDMTSLTSGNLSGLIALRDTTIPGYAARLDAVAAALITTTNAQSAAGFDLNGAPGGVFFSGTDAATIAINPALVTSPGLIAASGNGQPGNADNAIAMSGMQATPLVGGANIGTAYSQLVTQIGADAAQAMATSSNAAALAGAIDDKRQSISGVSLDEEMTNLLRYQRGYQACSRALSAMDEMLDQLINRTGKVGL